MTDNPLAERARELAKHYHSPEMVFDPPVRERYREVVADTLEALADENEALRKERDDWRAVFNGDVCKPERELHWLPLLEAAEKVADDNRLQTKDDWDDFEDAIAKAREVAGE